MSTIYSMSCFEWAVQVISMIKNCNMAGWPYSKTSTYTISNRELKLCLTIKIRICDKAWSSTMSHGTTIQCRRANTTSTSRVMDLSWKTLLKLTSIRFNANCKTTRTCLRSSSSSLRFKLTMAMLAKRAKARVELSIKSTQWDKN